ncbi:MAG: YjbH domain-containing protein [Pseudomonas sp.]
MIKLGPYLFVLGVAGFCVAPSHAQNAHLEFNAFGMPGAIDTPSASTLPDGTLMFTGFAMESSWRSSLTFQALPRVTVALRYSNVDDINWRIRTGTGLRDRSFDIQLQLLNEGQYTPALAVGLRDFIGTGAYSGEYIVASKTFSPQLRGSAGLGWGQLATQGAFSNPLGVLSSRFNDRPGGFTGLGGRIEGQQFFRGDAAAFANLEYRVNPDLSLLAEYSSFAYVREGLGQRRNTPFNFGFRYRVNEGTTLSGSIIQGTNVALSANFALNPKVATERGTRVTAPAPVLVRPRAPGQSRWDADWISQKQTWESALTEAWSPVFVEEGMRLGSVSLEERRAVIRVENLRHEILTRALGRTARISTYGLPPSIEEIVVIPTTNGIEGTAVVINRSALEANEFKLDGAQQILAVTRLEDPLSFSGGNRFWQPLWPDKSPFSWSVGPYFDLSYFDPNTPVRADVGVSLGLSYSFAENLSVSVDATQRILGNIAQGSIGPPSPGYPRVRTNSLLYSSDSPVLQRATLDYTFRPMEDLYGRVSLGLLERMYAGASAELLWSPADSPFAFGVEVNALQQRDPDSLIGTNDLQIDSWHASGYYSFGDGFLAQLDLGRYLAGDTGGTLTLEREFANGIRVGAYATLTDMAFDDFGEGSFDKGITVTIPIATLLGTPTTTRNTTNLNSITRDGGARVNISNRLYPSIRDTRQESLHRSWEGVLQ